VILFASSYLRLDAQLAIRVSYAPSFYQSEEVNHILDSWSDQDNPVTLGGWGLSHGIDFGFIQRIGDIGWTAQYTLGIGGSSANDNADNRYDMDFVHHQLGASLESYFGKLALGTTLHYNWLNISGELGTNESTKLDRARYISSRIYVRYMLSEYGTQRLGFEPFIDIPWSAGDPFNQSADFFDVNSSDGNAHPLIYGIRIVILNGS